jgi:4'-phosphopantetheinyl transferase
VPPERIEVDTACRRCGDPVHGKPHLVGDPLYFSASRSIDAVAIAVAAEEIGLDVEVRTRAGEIEDLRSRVMAADEDAGPGEDLLRLWVRKEACVKESGEGLVADLTRIRFEGLPPSRRAVREGESGWMVADVDPDGDVIGAVASRKSVREVALKHWGGL